MSIAQPMEVELIWILRQEHKADEARHLTWNLILGLVHTISLQTRVMAICKWIDKKCELAPILRQSLCKGNYVFRIGQRVTPRFFHSGQPIASVGICLQIKHVWFLDF